MTKKQVRDLIRKTLGETTSAFWQDAELNDWISDAGDDIAFETKCIKEDSYLTSVSGVSDYSLSSNFPNALAILKVYILSDGVTWRRLESINYDDLDSLYPGWKSAASGTPSMYYSDREEDVFGLYVPPNATNAGSNYVHVYYASKHTSAADDGSSCNLPSYLHMAMVHKVAARGFEQRGFGEKANDQLAKYNARVRFYIAERKREKEDDDIIMKNYKNI